MPPKQARNASNPPKQPAPPLTTSQEGSSSSQPQQAQQADGAAPKKKRHRGGRKRNRRQSFAAPSESSQAPEPLSEQRPDLPTLSEAQAHPSFYRLNNRAGSNTSLESEALLDHREQNQNPLRPRRFSVQQSQTPRASNPFLRPVQRSQHSHGGHSPFEDPSDDDFNNDDRTPLIGSHRQSRIQTGYGGLSSSRRRSNASSVSSRKRMPPRQMSTQSFHDDYDINNPPSVPGSPRLGGEDGYDDVMLPEMSSRSPDTKRNRLGSRGGGGGEAVIDIDPSLNRQSPRSPNIGPMRRRQTGTSPVEDVCLPFEQMTEIGEEEEDYMHQQHGGEPHNVHRRHRKEWPDLSVLEEWTEGEKDERFMEGIRAKKVDEPVLIGGRLRPQRGAWRREDEEEPFRWTYFNEEFDSSLRSHTISGLQQLGHSYKELFIPEPTELEDSSSDEEDVKSPFATVRSETPNGMSRIGTRQSSILDARGSESKPDSGERTPSKLGNEKPKRFGPRPVFWLDVLQPTWDEMRVLSRAFGIHKLTAEDIMEQEAREKVELFRNYYFVNYRTFEQDEKSEDYLDPVNMYFVVFKGGVISMPHPPNVRRRIRQLAEHQYTDSDWIAYAIIDNITDAYAPLIEQIEQEVDDIDDEILLLHHNTGNEKNKKGVPKNLKDSSGDKSTNGDDQGPADTSRDMLLRVGECRKRVMGLYRLLGNKADVIKGLAKRCNEQWQVAPRSDVGLYLGDIQDHIVTMTANLTHYESILSRAHSNYLAQINIGMNERAERTNDVLGKLTVLGTIVLPMNIVTGMWGMNCLVPGQVDDNPTLYWFFGLTTFLILFGLTSFFVAKKVYKIV